jgi:hypothetical protein
MGIGQPVARTEVEPLAVPQAPRCGRLRDQNTPTDAIAATSCVRDSGRREPAATEQSTSSRPRRPAVLAVAAAAGIAVSASLLGRLAR